MKNLSRSLKLLIITFSLIGNTILLSAQEKIFANYFDIRTNSTEGTEVLGKIHLERNKDVCKSPIPKGYDFEILEQEASLFRVETKYDLANRIQGVFLVNKDNTTGNIEREYKLLLALKDGDQVINTFTTTINIVKKTLWQTLFERYKDVTVSSKGSRMYGRTIFKDKEVENYIKELKEGQGRFKDFKFYDRHPSEYLDEVIPDLITGRRYGTIEYEWEKAAQRIGGLGYAYAMSKKYGPKGEVVDRKQLKEALYSAILAFTHSVPVGGDDVLIDGKPVGEFTGDGFANLEEHHLIGHQIATHHWVLTDPLVAPAVHLMPELIMDIKQNNQQAIKVHQALIRYYQLFSSTTKSRREISNPEQRWGNISDTIYSEGAWADANLGHRLRTMLALPIIWADYNRPSTYVPHWYSNFYNDKPFKDFSFSPGWSPHGVVSDVSRWLTKFKVPSHQFKQSGFHPDGTVSHHVGHGTDACMNAYGFGWLTEGIVGFNQFKDTPFMVDDKYYQFPADRLLNVYNKIMYKGQLDFTVAGRSFLADMEQFKTRSFLPAIEELIESKSENTYIENEAELLELHHSIKNGKHEYSGTDAFWVNEYLVHRRGENEKPFYASVKLKSERCVGAEDFDRVRKSWHTGSGVMQLRVKGNEYSQQVLKNMDWHMLPGITEEWRTDPLPAKGGAQASLPGLNKIAGVLSDGEAGMAIYHHLPGETYSSATALKSYHFIEEKIIAIGSSIKRFRSGQQRGIYTCLDQAALDNSDIRYSTGDKQKVLKASKAHDLSITIDQATWIHVGQKGYLIFPEKEHELVIKTGNKINTTDKKIVNNEANYIIAISHGYEPEITTNNQYSYVLLPNVSSREMPEMLKKFKEGIITKTENDSIHMVYSAPDKIAQIAFFKKGAIQVTNSLKIESDNTAMVMTKENNDNWTVSVCDPRADLHLKTITLQVSIQLKAGKYHYEVPGIYPREGEYVTVSNNKNGSTIVVELPDERDEAFYNYQSVLYAGVPIKVIIPKTK